MSVRSELDKLMGRNAPALTRIIVVNTVIFIIANLYVNIGRSEHLLDYVGLSSSPRYVLYHPWTLFTYMFLHIELFHILFNMLWLYWMGQLFIEYLGERKFVYTYILGGLSGGLLYLIVSALTNSPPSLLMGASAGIMAIIIAVAVLLPNYPIFLFLIGEVKLKYVALGAFILTSIIDFSSNSGGKISHIGGALYGWIYVWQGRRGYDFANILNSFFKRIGNIFSSDKSKSKRAKMTVSRGGKSDKQKRIDDILDKISRSGYDSLSKEEKDFLFKSSKE
jgi:membrane associated rhomboid family serine protease